MFFDWFGTESSIDSFGLYSVGRSAWNALDYISVVLLITIIAALAIVALRLANVIGRASFLPNAGVALLAGVSALLIFFRIIDPPSFGGFGSPFGPVIFEGTVQFPMYLALLAAVGIAFGGCWAMHEGGVSRLRGN